MKLKFYDQYCNLFLFSNKISYKYEKPLKNEDKLNKFERSNNLRIPDDIKKLIVKYSGGMPSPCKLKLKHNTVIIQQILTDSELETVYNNIKNTRTLKNFIPFCDTSSGDIIAVDAKSNKIYLIDHETYKKYFISNNLFDFLDMLC